MLASPTHGTLLLVTRKIIANVNLIQKPEKQKITLKPMTVHV